VPADRWADGDAYERFVGRWSRAVAPRFVDWLGVSTRSDWIDVGCGTGALSATVAARADPASILGVDPSAPFVEAATATVRHPAARFAVGSADAIPAPDGSADAVVAGLVLNFVPDVGRALAEARRVARPGAVVAGYVWDYAGRMQPIRAFWDAAVELDPGAAPQDEGRRFPIAAPGPLRDAFREAGLREVETGEVEIPARFRDFDDYWSPFTADIAPAPGYATRLPEDRRAALRERLRAMLPANPDGSIDLVARAWVVRGQA
jgi:SAM-dependent methyltransferase